MCHYNLRSTFQCAYANEVYGIMQERIYKWLQAGISGY